MRCGRVDDLHPTRCEPPDDPHGLSAVSHPIEGQIVLLAGAKASVALTRMDPLLQRAARHLERVDCTQYERVHVDDDGAIYLVPPAFWRDHGTSMGLERREWDAIRRAHEEQLLRVGRRTGRRDEFETALEIRSAVVVEVA
mgnify:CR=1 FL=1